MTKTHQAVQGAESDTVGLDSLLRGVQTYLSERFPVSQAGAVLSSYACCYLLYGHTQGHQVFRWATVVGGITVVLLALFRRIVDDAEDLRDDIRSGRFSDADGGGRRLRGLILGGLAAVALTGLLNASCSLGLLAASVGVAAWVLVVMLIQGKTVVAKSRGLQYIVVETCPAVLLLYSYVVWVRASGGSVPTLGVTAIVGLFWTAFQFWSFTRKMGTEAWAPWRLSVSETRRVLIAFLALTAACNALIYHYVHLPSEYLLYGLTLPGVFVVLVLRRWSQFPTHDPKRMRPSWAGLPFGVAVEGGVLIAVLVASL